MGASLYGKLKQQGSLSPILRHWFSDDWMDIFSLHTVRILVGQKMTFGSFFVIHSFTRWLSYLLVSCMYENK